MINRKHEMFWNDGGEMIWENLEDINRKHEMFWNRVLKIDMKIITNINRKHEMFWNVGSPRILLPHTD